MKPIVDAQEGILRAREREDLIALVPRYNTFVLLLGMVRPMQVDGVRDRDGVVYNAYLAPLLSRGQYYDLHKHCRPDVVDLIEAVIAHRAAAWTMGGTATGDETLVPHTGLRAGPLKMYIVRKPHNTGIKLYCLADAGTGYIVDVYLYTGRRGVLRRHGCGAGNLNARQLMAMWSKQLPAYTVLVGDSFLGSHATAQRLAREGRPFITMVRKDTASVQQAGDAIQAGQTAVATVDGHKYALQVYKQLKPEANLQNWCRSCPRCGTLRRAPGTTRAGKSTPSLLCTAKWHGGWTLPTRWRCTCASWEGRCPGRKPCEASCCDTPRPMRLPPVAP